MGIDIAGCADIAVPQPLLNLLQAHAVGVKQACAAVAQVVEADTLHLVCDQKIREMLTQKVGPNPLSHRVYIKNTAWGTDIQTTANHRGLSVAAQAAVWNNSLVSSIIFQNFD